NFVAGDLERRAFGEAKMQDSERARFVGDEINETAVFLLQLLRGLADVAAENDLTLVEAARQFHERGFVGEGEENDEVGFAANSGECFFDGAFHVADAQAGAGSSRGARIDDADERDALSTALDDAI